jgi:hypothetical protein
MSPAEIKSAEPMAYERVPDDYRELAAFIDLLYQQVSEEASDSPRVSEQCLALLHTAREMLEKNDYVGAEYKAEQVKARLLRARASTVAAGSFGIKALWAWYALIGLVSVVTIVLPFFLHLVPGIVPLIRAVALGTLGGVMGGLWNLTSYLHSRDYDPAYTPDYWASPIKGALVGGVIFLLSALGVIAAPGALGTGTFLGALHSTHFLMYFLALLSGIAQDYIFEFVRGVLAAIFRAPTRALKDDRA